ncbi:MAG: UGSC family (seleno)protein, partial [bacterium]
METAPDPFEHFFDLPWSDGLPVVTPTEARLAWMLEGTSRAPGEVLGPVPPADHEATVEGAAMHAVMAGCRPAHLPLVLGALEALLIESFNLGGIQATMGPGGPLLILNGPFAREAGLHAGSGCFGPGFRANATVGRAIRLLLMNLGGALPGISDMSTFGSPCKFTYCVRENEEQSPWPPLAADRGFGAGENVLTAMNGEAPRMAMDDT